MANPAFNCNHYKLSSNLSLFLCNLVELLCLAMELKAQFHLLQGVVFDFLIYRFLVKIMKIKILSLNALLLHHRLHPFYEITRKDEEVMKFQYLVEEFP